MNKKNDYSCFDCVNAKIIKGDPGDYWTVEKSIYFCSEDCKDAHKVKEALINS